MKKIISLFITVVMLLCCFSCKSYEFGYFYVVNKTNSDIVDFEISWIREGEKISQKINLIPAKKRSENYATYLFDDKCSLLTKTKKVPFDIKYEKNGEIYSINNSKTIEYDTEGNAFDEEAYMQENQEITIEIYNDGFSISHAEM